MWEPGEALRSSAPRGRAELTGRARGQEPCEEERERIEGKSRSGGEEGRREEKGRRRGGRGGGGEDTAG